MKSEFDPALIRELAMCYARAAVLELREPKKPEAKPVKSKGGGKPSKPRRP